MYFICIFGSFTNLISGLPNMVLQPFQQNNGLSFHPCEQVKAAERKSKKGQSAASLLHPQQRIRSTVSHALNTPKDKALRKGE